MCLVWKMSAFSGGGSRSICQRTDYLEFPGHQVVGQDSRSSCFKEGFFFDVTSISRHIRSLQKTVIIQIKEALVR